MAFQGKRGAVGKMREMLRTGKITDVNFMSGRTGKTPLQRAVESGHFEIMKFLIEEGGDINSRVNRMTLLHFAALMVKDAASDTKTYRRWFSLSPVWHGQNIDAMKFLVGRGVDVTIQDETGKTALDYVESATIKAEIMSAGAPAQPVPAQQPAAAPSLSQRV